MKLVVIFLNKIELLEDLLTAFLEIGVSGATIVDSVGMGHIISQNIPIFAGLRDAFAGSSPLNKLILVITEEEMLKPIEQVLEEVCATMDDARSYFSLTLSIDSLNGY